jgi:hypothetical protein
MILSGSHLENKPCKQYRVCEYGERSDCGDRIAGRMARVNEPNANGHDDCADNPNQDLRNGQTVRFNRRVQTIEDAKEKQRHEAEQIEMGVSGECRVVIGNGHLQAPDHSGEQEQHCGSETQVRWSHGFPLIRSEPTGATLVVYRAEAGASFFERPNFCLSMPASRRLSPFGWPVVATPSGNDGSLRIPPGRSRREWSWPIGTVHVVVVGRIAVLDRFNPHERGFLVVLLLDGGVANSQPRIGQTSQRFCFAVVTKEHCGS